MTARRVHLRRAQLELLFFFLVVFTFGEIVWNCRLASFEQTAEDPADGTPHHIDQRERKEEFEPLRGKEGDRTQNEQRRS